MAGGGPSASSLGNRRASGRLRCAPCADVGAPFPRIPALRARAPRYKSSNSHKKERWPSETRLGYVPKEGPPDTSARSGMSMRANVLLSCFARGASLDMLSLDLARPWGLLGHTHWRRCGGPLAARAQHPFFRVWCRVIYFMLGRKCFGPVGHYFNLKQNRFGAILLIIQIETILCRGRLAYLVDISIWIGIVLGAFGLYLHLGGTRVWAIVVIV